MYVLLTTYTYDISQSEYVPFQRAGKAQSQKLSLLCATVLYCVLKGNQAAWTKKQPVGIHVFFLLQ